MSFTQTEDPLTQDELARLIAADIAPGSFVNLGIGQPTTVSDYLDADKNVTLHTENGMLGFGPQAHGGHIDVSVLGAYQVSATGDLANWSTGKPDAIPAVGGAMDLAVGAKDTYVMMDLFAKKGDRKLMAECTFPLTGVGCVSRIYADRGVFLLDGSGVVKVRELHGITFEELQERHEGVTFQTLDA